jgi:CheY-like chemotaxis protein
MLRRLLFENIEVVVSLESNAAKIRIDATQLEQILINLVVNARDAMPRGGRLTIATRSAPTDGSVALIVADTGEGMDEATRARIFEPFFTTKGPGKGTGLGLATVQRIAKQCDGSVEVTSDPANGTVFRIHLPRVAHSSATHLAPHAVTDASSGSETVLLAEDDPSVRLLARLSLQRRGYTVLEAGDATEALAVAEDHGKPIDLLLSDVIMPNAGDTPLIDRLRRIHPDLRVLYMSGYTDDAIIHHGVLDEGTAFLQKPFTPQALAQKVRDVLDEVRP